MNKYRLHDRWKLEDDDLVYYGLRKKPYTFKNRIHVSTRTKNIVKNLNVDGFKATHAIKSLIRQGIIVDTDFNSKSPASFSDAVWCKTCCANDYVIPGIVFNKDGICPICDNFKSVRKYRSVLPVVKNIEKDVQNDYDVAVFYTGGKDSSFLLHYLCNVLKLRVVALTWKIPFMSKSALGNMKNAKRHLENCTFIVKELDDEDIAAVYKKSYELNGNTCICPFPAYVLFIDLLREMKIRYLVLGNEPAQMNSHIFNNISKRFMYMPFVQMMFRSGYNFMRVFKGLKPLKKGQVELLILLETLAFSKPTDFYTKTTSAGIIRNIHISLSEAEKFMKAFQITVESCRKDAVLPSLVHFDFADISKDGYDWMTVKKLLKDNLGWKDMNNDKNLHMSCMIEKYKDYSQLKSFTEMKSSLIPLSALELCIAVNMKNISRETAIKELVESCGFTDNKPCEHDIMTKPFM